VSWEIAVPDPRPIIITGAAGLVGQNLIARLKAKTKAPLIAIDKHPANVKTLARLHPEVRVIEADLARPGPWQAAFEGAGTLVLNHAQIGALTQAPFEANNITATRHVLDAAKTHKLPYIVHISSSVVNSAAHDFYTESKKAQEKLVVDSGIPTCVLRPTLMFGWFDRKHLGWLARFMAKAPVFPVPGHGGYTRQPLYAGDLCVATPRPAEIYNISGREQISYLDLIRAVKTATGAKTPVVRIPYSVFWVLLKAYALVDRDPPFTTTQLEALVIPETFEVIDWPAIFGTQATPLAEALAETFQHPVYSKIVLEF
jgi:nucleoside-diphosphate-sugar epimerase